MWGGECMVNPGVSVLMYHSIADNPRDPHSVAPEEFSRQMLELAERRCSVISLAEAIHTLRSLRNIFDSVVITFDDAYENFLTDAAPILHRHGFPASIFVPTGLVGKTAVWDSYDQSKRLMDWDQLAEVSRQGFCVGSHTINHPRLTECTPTDLEFELKGSLETLCKRIPDVLPVISYPGGFFGRREMKAAKAAGYIGGVGVASRWKNYPWTNPFHIRRRRWG